jgi:sigma-B regulation protein RsbU (phosphoserine phosphatase)
VPKALPTSSFTSEFHQEFEAHTHTLLRARFLWFSGLLTALAVAMLLMSLTAGLAALDLPALPAILRPFARAMAPGARTYLAWGVMLVVALAYLTCYLLAKRGSFEHEGMLRLTYLLVVADGFLRVGGAWAHVPGTIGLWGVAMTHFLACLFLPWTPSQAIKPLVPVIALAELRWLLSGLGAGELMILLACTPLVGLPGTLLCAVRHSQRLDSFKLRFFQRRYGEVRRELVDARRIHESLFPGEINRGPIRFSYLYQPMRLIGGDYLFACRAGREKSDDSPLNIVLIDVTGHGIPAALTVNRLHGELSRIFAEDPDIRPGGVLSLLNRYVHLTLADHSVYVTALCLRFDIRADRLEFANGGHPPAYLKGVDGTVHELVSTAFVLGACADADFRPDPDSVRFGPGDALIAYTDGALEARDHSGRMIGLAGMRKLVASGRAIRAGDWPRLIVAAVDAHRRGPAEDDTLVVEVVRTIEEVPPRSSFLWYREKVRT